MERNVDKIKRLEHELGRWRKKVADTAKENEKLREWEYYVVLMRRVCNNHIDPMNRYNEDYSLYCRVCFICVVLFAGVAFHSLLSCGECHYSSTYPLFTSLFL